MALSRADLDSGAKPIIGFAEHRRVVDDLIEQYRAIPAGSPVRLAKKTSNLFRARSSDRGPGLRVDGLDTVIAVDPQARTADVGGMCTYEHLVATTLPFGLVPLVVPQLKTITLGGAVTGLGIESTSFRNGLPHESVLEVDVLTGSGEVITATPDGPHADLFHGFPNSYGTLGYSTRLKIELEPVEPFVELRHVRFDALGAMVDAISEITESRSYLGEAVDYLDGVVYSANESYLSLGRKTDKPGPVSDYTGQQIYYLSMRHNSAAPKRDRLTIADYIWRWDTDWFWCSRAFGTQNPRIRRVWPKRYRRSSFYWKLIALDQRFGIADRLEARKGNPPRERVVQDIEVPLERTEEFVSWFLDSLPIEPIWLCPLRLRDFAGTDQSPTPGRRSIPDRHWPLYPLEPKRTYVNVGFWSSVPATPGDPGYANRLIEQQVSALDGHKSLYSEAFYSREEFDNLYGGEHYRQLRETYDPHNRLLDLYSKVVQRR